MRCHDGASNAPLALEWQYTFGGVNAESLLTLVLEAFEPLTVSLELVSYGLDFRTVTLPYGSYALTVGQRVFVQVRLADLPLQGVSFSSYGNIETVITRADGSVIAQPAVPFYHHFSSDYRTSYVYDFDTMTRELGGGQLTGDAFDLVGRIWLDDRFVDIGDVRTMEYGGSPPPPYSAPYSDFAFAPGIATQPAEGFPVCVDWGTKYIDAGHGEDFANSPTNQSTDASFAEFEIGHVVSTPCEAKTPSDPCIDVVWQGRLDADGCTKLPGYQTGQSYFIWVYSKLVRNTVEVDVNLWTIFGNAGIQRWRLPFPKPTLQDPVPSSASMTTYSSYAAHAVAPMSRLLLTDLTVAGSNYIVWANRPCDPPVPNAQYDACANGSTLFAGTWAIPGGIAGDLQYKYVVAHEAGHVVQEHGSGVARGDLDGDLNPYNDVSSLGIALCACSHVVTSNKYHCLQSRETTAAAQAEGFGQFVGAKLFNDPSGPDCRFNYYKEFLTPQLEVKGPPYDVDCRNAVKWRDTHCGSAPDIAGTEFDWMQFFWNVNTVGANTSTMADIFQIWKDACPHPHPQCQDSEQLTWADLDDAAEAHFGMADPRYLNFRSDGDDFAVDSDS